MTPQPHNPEPQLIQPTADQVRVLEQLILDERNENPVQRAYSAREVAEFACRHVLNHMTREQREHA